MKSLIDSFDVSRDDIERLVAQSLKGSDDGELFVEYREAEALVFDNGRLKTGSFNQTVASVCVRLRARPSVTPMRVTSRLLL